jgi:hypothetical protein
MKDFFKDIIQYTHGIGKVELVKVVEADKSTNVYAIGEGNSVIISGAFSQTVDGLTGTFGMPNMNKLKTIISFDDIYDDKAIISVVTEEREGVTTPVAIHFETESKDFVNDYRLMVKQMVENKVATVSFKVTPTWNVEFEPTIVNILKLKKQAQANAEETNFTAKTEDTKLKLFFGSPSAHSGNLVFHDQVTANALTKQWEWPVDVFLAIMDLPGNKIVRISNQGVIQVEVDSGLAVYKYNIPAKTK